jgi:hypothetical protein
MRIKTPDDWWELVEQEWHDLRKTLIMFLDKSQVEDAKRYIENKNHSSLHTLFEEAWYQAPDDGAIHFIPGWGNLCDLCSEFWVFDTP